MYDHADFGYRKCIVFDMVYSRSVSGKVGIFQNQTLDAEDSYHIVLDSCCLSAVFMAVFPKRSMARLAVYADTVFRERVEDACEDLVGRCSGDAAI